MKKAYEAWDNETDECGHTIVFAENVKEAKKIAHTLGIFEGTDYIQLRVKRLPKADKLYKGHPEMDWYDDETRLTLVKELGWFCGEVSASDCDSCPAKDYCLNYLEKW